MLVMQTTKTIPSSTWYIFVFCHQVVMANVGGQLGSNANSPTSSRGTSLVERVSHLEMQALSPPPSLITLVALGYGLKSVLDRKLH